MTYYVVQGCAKVLWKIAKGKMEYNSFEDLLNQIEEELHTYLGHESHFSQKEIVQLCINEFANYVEFGNVRAHQVRDMFETIYGSPVRQMVFGEDTRPLDEKIVVGVLGLLRLSQVKAGNTNIVLINYGQYDE